MFSITHCGSDKEWARLEVVSSNKAEACDLIETRGRNLSVIKNGHYALNETPVLLVEPVYECGVCSREYLRCNSKDCPPAVRMVFVR